MSAEQLITCQQAGARFGKMCFSQDSRYLLSCCGTIVKVFSTSSGECLHDLKAHSKTVTGVYINPNNVLQLYSCGQDRLLIVWDYLDGVKLKHYNLLFPLYGIINVEKRTIMIIAETPQKKGFNIMQWKKKKRHSNNYEKPKLLIGQCSASSGHVSFGCSREIVASCLKDKLTVYSMTQEEETIIRDDDKYNKDHAITCVACHPHELIIATGLDNGRIILWHNFLTKGQAPVASRLHWHALSVLCLAYTPNGSHLLSGGHECVLVKWQMSRPDMRDYKPRMGAPLTQLLSSPDGTFTASQHADNVVQLLNVNHKVIQAYRGMTRGWLSPGNPAPCGLTFDPRSKSVVTNGLPGHLQFYSLALNKQLFNLDIVGENYISSDSLERQPAVTEVQCVALSSTGDWLATFQCWDDGEFTPELKLKLWQWTSEAQTYSLNTTVESPHDAPVTHMTFRPQVAGQPEDSVNLLTLGLDMCFKLWGLTDDTDIYRKNQRWNCESVGFYRGLGATAADFSHDGTALAVGFGHLVTLWDPDHNVVQTTLSQATKSRPTVTHTLFGSKEHSHNLVVATNKTLVVWDLLTLSMHWQMDQNISHLLRDPASDLMACIVEGAQRKSSLHVFFPNTCTPVYMHHDLPCVLSALFIPGARDHDLSQFGWPGASQIYMFTQGEELITLELPRGDTREGQVKIAEHVPSSAMKAFLAEKKQVRHMGGDGSARSVSFSTPGLTSDEFITAMLHSNEPVSNLCGQFLKHLLVKSSKQETDQSLGDQDDNSSSDEEMEIDDKEVIKNKKIEQNSKDEHKDEDIDKLLSKSTKWIEWAAELKI